MPVTNSLPWIGGPVINGTAGSVLFVGTAGIFQQSNANLFWDNSNNRLGIGTAIPSTDLSLGGEVARTIAMETRLGSANPGQRLTLAAGSAAVGSTNKASGGMTFAAGLTTGSVGSGSFIWNTVLNTNPSGTNTNAYVSVMTLVGGSLTLGVGGANPTMGAKLAVTTNSAVSPFTFTQKATLSSNPNPPTFTITHSNATGVSGSSAFSLNQTVTLFGASFGGTSQILSLNGSIDIDTTNAAGTLSIYGTNAGVSVTSTGTIGATNLIGDIYTTLNFSTGTTALTIGAYRDFYVDIGAGTQTTMIGFQSDGQTIDANVGTFSGFYFKNPGSASKAGTITTLNGLYLETPTAGTTNYAIYSAGGQSVHAGKVGIGAVTQPTALLLLAAGAAGANNAPLKFTSGTNLTTPEAGTVEFDGSKWYMTI